MRVVPRRRGGASPCPFFSAPGSGRRHVPCCLHGRFVWAILSPMPRYRWEKCAKIPAKKSLCRSNAQDKERGMAPQDACDSHTFLAKGGSGRTLMTHQEQRPIFTQGEAGRHGVFSPGRASEALGRLRAGGGRGDRPPRGPGLLWGGLLGRAAKCAWPRPRRSPTAC